MKIVIISTSDGGAGGFVAAYRLIHALRHININVKMLVMEKNTFDVNVEKVRYILFNKIFSKVRHGLDVLLTSLQIKYFNNRFLFSAARFGIDISTHPLVQSADIIHLHWIGKSYLSISSINKLLKLGKPVFWTLHDMWAFTGGCFYSQECNRYETGCGNCPYLRLPSKDDLSRRVIKRKLKMDLANIYVLPVSEWLANRARKSFLLDNVRITAMPNNIDTNQFKPSLRNEILTKLNLPIGKKIICFGASKLIDLRKGYSYFREAVEQLNIKKEDFEIILFGEIYPQIILPKGFRVHLLGKLTEAEIISCYSASDIFVAPSLEETFGLVVIEAMSCQTPVAAFASGGIPEIISHKENGWLAPTGDSKMLAEGIEWILADDKRLANLGTNARQHVIDNYSRDVIANRHLNLYREAISNKIARI